MPSEDVKESNLRVHESAEGVLVLTEGRRYTPLSLLMILVGIGFAYRFVWTWRQVDKPYLLLLFAITFLALACIGLMTSQAIIDRAHQTVTIQRKLLGIGHSKTYPLHDLRRIRAEWTKSGDVLRADLKRRRGVQVVQIAGPVEGSLNAAVEHIQHYLASTNRPPSQLL